MANYNYDLTDLNQKIAIKRDFKTMEEPDNITLSVIFRDRFRSWAKEMILLLMHTELNRELTKK